MPCAATDTSASCSITCAELGVCVVEGGQASARRNLPLVGDRQEKLAVSFILDKASQARPEAWVPLLARNEAAFETEACVDCKENKINKSNGMGC
jgi:hypothetical protein